MTASVGLTDMVYDMMIMAAVVVIFIVSYVVFLRWWTPQLVTALLGYDPYPVVKQRRASWS